MGRPVKGVKPIPRWYRVVLFVLVIGVVCPSMWCPAPPPPARPVVPARRPDALPDARPAAPPDARWPVPVVQDEVAVWFVGELRKIANKCPAARYARRPDARRPEF
jgi:hypothetical protein